MLVCFCLYTTWRRARPLRHTVHSACVLLVLIHTWISCVYGCDIYWSSRDIVDLAHRHIIFNPSKFELSLATRDWGGVVGGGGTNRETYRRTEKRRQMGKYQCMVFRIVTQHFTSILLWPSILCFAFWSLVFWPVWSSCTGVLQPEVTVCSWKDIKTQELTHSCLAVRMKNRWGTTRTTVPLTPTRMGFDSTTQLCVSIMMSTFRPRKTTMNNRRVLSLRSSTSQVRLQRTTEQIRLQWTKECCC